MSIDQPLAEIVRQHQVEQFLYEEAAMLDERRFDDWVELFAADATYFCPIRRTVQAARLDHEFTQPGEMAFFDDTKEMLQARVTKLSTGRSWSEDPPSRTRRLITNVRVTDDDGTTMEVWSNFMLYRTRLKSEEDTWLGSRRDQIRRTDDGLRIAERTIYLEQTVLLSRNLSNFF